MYGIWSELQKYAHPRSVGNVTDTDGKYTFYLNLRKLKDNNQLTY
jgi:hypothetical protein